MDRHGCRFGRGGASLGEAGGSGRQQKRQHRGSHQRTMLFTCEYMSSAALLLTINTWVM